MGALNKAADHAERLRRLALEEGAAVAGIAAADEPVTHAEAFRGWLERGDHSPMEWIERHGELRVQPEGLLPGLKGMLCVGVSCRHEAVDPQDRPRVARYARGRDYHRVLKGLLRRVARRMEAEIGPFGWRICVDTVPLLERYWAWRAGLGWIGKNCMLIHREHGTWLMLGELLTDLSLQADAPGKEYCGRCSRCLEGCPTQAFRGPGQLISERCISAQTIENRGTELPSAMRPLPQNWLFGCDVCQLVCPWNGGLERRGGASAGHPELQPDPELEALLESGNWPEEAELDEEGWIAFHDRITRGKALRRMTVEMLRRNLRAVRKGKEKKGPCPQTGA